MTGHLNMGNHYINNVLNPANAQDAATKNYVDMRKPITAVWAEENGPTTDGNYEWSFGNGSDGEDHGLHGYCVPAMGRIIRGSLSAAAWSTEAVPDLMTVNIVKNGVEQTTYSITKPPLLGVDINLTAGIDFSD